MFEHKHVEAIQSHIPLDRYPLFVKPNSFCASLGIDERSVVHTPDELIRRAHAVFRDFPQLRELRLEPDFSQCRQFTVGVVGNGDRTVTSVCELIFPEHSSRIYTRAQKNIPLSSRDVRYALVEDSALHDELAYHGRRVFAHLGMRDYGRLDFFLTDEILLHDVNSHPTLGNSFSWEWQRSWGMALTEIFALPLVAFHYRQLADGKGSRLPAGVLSSMPIAMSKFLSECAPVTAPPELTPPSAECPDPWSYHCVDGIAVETEVLGFLDALVRLVKPLTVVETGTYRGASGETIARALARNGHGRLVTIELDADRAIRAARRLACLPAKVVNSGSLDYRPDGTIDMLFLDSHRPLRIKEFQHFLPYLTKDSLVVWHDSAATTPRFETTSKDSWTHK